MTIDINDVKAAAERLQGISIRTPLLYSTALNERLGMRVWIKPECLQHIGAFKFRGAYNRLVQLSQDERTRGVVAFSSGNHAQGIAYAAKLLNMPATIVMPTDAPAIKKAGTLALGATIKYYDRYTESREQIAAQLAAESGSVLVPAFDDVDIIAGQGTCGLELMQQCGERHVVPDSVIVPCGGGGLLAGVATAVNAESPGTRIYGVEPANYDDHYLSRLAGKRIQVNPDKPTYCDSLMSPMPGEITWPINNRLATDFLVVSDTEVAHAVSFAFRYLKLVVEAGGAVALAALLSNKLPTAGENVALVLSGGNIDRETLFACLEKFPEP